MKILFNIQSRS